MMHHDALQTPTAGQAQFNVSTVKRGKHKESGQALHAAFLDKNSYDEYTDEELLQVVISPISFCVRCTGRSPL